MSHAILDDHLLRDLLADSCEPAVTRLFRTHQPATTNLYYLRLCRAVASAPGGALTGRLGPAERGQLGRALLVLPDAIELVPMRSIAFDMAELSWRYKLSALGAEAIAAASFLAAPLCVWEGDDGPRIRAAARAEGLRYRTYSRPPAG